MKRFWKLVVLCSMGLALGACGSDSSDGSGTGTGGGAGSGGGGTAATILGSCDKPDHNTCVDYACGASCDAYLSEMQSKCDGTWSTTECKSGAIVRCQFNISGFIAITNYYDGDPADRENTCTMGGGTVL